jgi:hypothetical protein
MMMRVTSPPRVRRPRGDTIQWKSDEGEIEITFLDGSLFCPAVTFPITAKKGKWTKAHTFHAKPAEPDYKYTALVKTGSNPPPKDDPHIMFDVRDDDIRKLGFPNPADIATAAEKAWEKLFDKLSTLKQTKDATGIQFYPHGINNIEVSVGFAGVTISIQVSGPDS